MIDLHAAPNLAQIFLVQATQTPHAPALVLHATQQTLTYAQLAALAHQTSVGMAEAGVGLGHRVVLHLPRGIGVHRAMLGALLRGAAFVPTDDAFPFERVSFIAKDCNAVLICTTPAKAPAFRAQGFTVLEIDNTVPDSLAPIPVPLVAPAHAATNLAYIIYTSGTTGTPKGVMISHQAAAHWLQAEAEFLRLHAEDTVYQGFSPAFDMSLEETWPAYHAGAKLYVADDTLVKQGPDVVETLEAAGVTIWHCVPSLLGAVEKLPSRVRLINVGGEACPAQVAQKVLSQRPELVLWNTYGPTETTVTATAIQLHAGDPITIGHGLNGYGMHVVDENLHPVLQGQEGELCISGPTLALGYVNRPDLTAEKFTTLSTPEGPLKVYRTGDLVTQRPDGALEYAGRIDTQIKLRGYRIELSEIESALLEVPEVAETAVNLWAPENAAPQLVAYLVPKPKKQPDITSLRISLSHKLPAYMVPSRYEILSEMPRLVSGKINRKALPAPTFAPDDDTPPANLTPMENRLWPLWRKAVGNMPFDAEDDFFETLGGHSLLAAQFVSSVRTLPEGRKATVQMLYTHRTLKAFAHALTQAVPVQEQTASYTAVSPLRHAWAGFLQGVLLLPLLGIYGVSTFGPYALVAGLFALDDVSILQAVAAGLGAMVLVPPFLALIALAAKWTVLGKVSEGRYPLWSSYYLRWWLVRRLHGMVPMEYMAGTGLLVAYYRLMGASIGKNVFLGDVDIDVPDLCTIGEGSSLNAGTILGTSAVEGGELVLRRVEIGKDCRIGTSSVVGGRASLQNGAVLEDLSMLPPHFVQPENTTYLGSPAQPANAAVRPAPAAPNITSSGHALLIGTALLLPLLAATPFIPGMALLVHTEILEDPLRSLILSPWLAIVYFIGTVTLLVVGKWLVMGRQPARNIPLGSNAYVRFWFVTQLYGVCQQVIHSSYATLFTPWLFRALGARIGRRTEVSTAQYVTPDLLTIGNEAFIADAAVLGAPCVDRGVVQVAPVVIGDRSFAGNNAVIPINTTLGANALVGVLSRPPQGEAALTNGATWLGSPPLQLSARPAVAGINLQHTFQPPWWLVILRLSFELVRMLLSLTLLVALTILVLAMAWHVTEDELSVPALMAGVFAVYTVAAFLLFMMVVLLKWLVVGRQTPTVAPLWSTYVWRTELVSSTYEAVAVPLLLNHLRGTPFLPFFLRLLGVKIGKRVYLDTADFTEFDIVSIKDEAMFNDNSGPQTHLFEDRVMRVGQVNIGARAEIGSGSIVLMSSTMEDGSKLGDLSLVMKGEILPANTSWAGIPVKEA